MGLFFALSFSAATFLLGIQRGQCAYIGGGKESVPHSKPYIAALIDGTHFFCGGTLINEKWVLTAAQCSRNRRQYVVLGAHDLKDKKEKGRQSIQIIKKFIHPDYNTRTNEHDITLLKLQKEAKINEYVRPVQLLNSSEDVQPGTNCLVAGWGRTQDQKRPSDKLHEANVRVIDTEICNDKDHYAGSIVKDNMLCAGDEQGGKACEGDGGSPLICDGNPKGIVSFGKTGRCGDNKYPDVYTLLTKDHVSWIQNTIKDNP